MKNKFDQENHIFYMDDEQVPSITQAMPTPKFYVSPERLEELKIEGSENHALIKMYYDTGDIFNEPMLFALDIWQKENKNKLGKLLLHEKHLFSERHKFAGIPDAIFENTIVEFKRSFSNKNTHALQAAAQHILAMENNIVDTPINEWLVVWYDKGKMKQKDVFNKDAESIFLKLVDKWYIDQEVQKYMERK